MKKKSFLIFIFFIMCILFPTKIQAAKSAYEIKSYNIDMIVNENNSFDITETINVNFNEERHGIIRKIPIINLIKRNDNTKSTNVAIISNIEVNEEYKKTFESTDLNLKIGSANQTIIGEHTYVIKYKYYIGKDPIKDADELYFNLIGTKWDTNIDKVNFKITMPKEFDASSLGFSSGYSGSTDSSNVKYSVNGNVITGYIVKPLNENQGLTVRLTLPNWYFVNFWTYLEKYSAKIIIGLCGIFVFIATILWFKYGKDRKVIETIEFYPPEGYNSAEIGYMYYGKPTKEAIISVLVELANENCIKIEEIEKDGIFKNKTFRITKLKEYSGDDLIKRKFFKGLFEKGQPDENFIEEYIKQAESKGEKITKYKIYNIRRRAPVKYVMEKDLKNEFYTTIDSIIDILDKKSNRSKIYEQYEDKQKNRINNMIAIVMYLGTFKIFYNYLSQYLFGFFVAAFGALIFKGLICFVFDFLLGKKNIKENWKTVLFSLCIIGVITYFGVIPALNSNKENTIMYSICLIGAFILDIFEKLMPRRTEFGTQILGKIRGFKRFLKTAEKNKLEALVRENPQYFYDILPYTYALGVSKTWIKQFETIAIDPPSWLELSNNQFDYRDFDRVFNDTMDSVTLVMTHAPYLVASGDSSGDSSSSWSSSSDSSSGGGSVGRRLRRPEVEALGNNNN